MSTTIIMPRLTTIVAVLALCTAPVFADYTEPCFTRPTRSIPSDHLMATKTKPLVIGHRGNPMKYQENTLDGFKSLLQTNADGFEMDIYLTKDKQLVAFHDDNAKMLTGVSKIMWETDASELTKLNVNRTRKIGGKLIDYDKPRPIPLLKDVLEVMKNSGKLMILEIKPNTRRDKNESETAGRTLAKLVTDLGLINQVIITSLDPWKSLAAYQENPDIVTGYFYHPKDCNASSSPRLYKVASGLPGMQECLQTAQNDTFFKGMFKFGDVLKAINASCMDMMYSFYDNPTCFNNTFTNLKRYYNPSMSVGAFTLYALTMSSEELDGQDAVVDRLKKQGVQRFITDDIDRMLVKLGRPIKPPTAIASHQKPFGLDLVVAAFSFVLFAM